MATDKVESVDAALAGLAVELPDVVIVLDYEGRLLWGNRARGAYVRQAPRGVNWLTGS